MANIILKETIDHAIKNLWNCKPKKKKEKTKFSKKETIIKITPTIERMRSKGFSFEEIALKFTEKDIPLKVKDIVAVFEKEEITENRQEDILPSSN